MIDNSLGKSFLLDAAWYCLTRRWPQEVNPGLSSGAMLTFTVDGEQRQQSEYDCHFDLEDETWLGQAGRPVNPGLVVYAMADGKRGSTSSGHICVIPFQLIYVPDCKFDGTAEVRFVGKGQAVNQDIHPAPLPFQLLEHCLHLVRVLRDVR